MTNDKTSTDSENEDKPQDSLYTEFSHLLNATFGKGLEEHQRQKIREELVRDYILNKEKQPAAIRRVLSKLFKSW